MLRDFVSCLAGWLLGVVSVFVYASTLNLPTWPDDCESVVLDDPEPVDVDVVAALEELEAARERTRGLQAFAIERARELIALLERDLADCEAARAKP